uniref:Taurine transport system substrate-binding protein n=1 Tax=Candidatus Kentrum sp. FM TaxID=2126340 RepID=A0A450VYJ5_9GAMM|nr:MAG: taurine transport system substrate-binding protein [Candidatus Kentron sp. FM]VFJ53649.1 MAG: taurine transport system substrate-binding protein [Candidatus Kentron sp. FM]VFK09877.1 MAG: taurine transport system substrate-binding protein [Candidatus Kentron sp. FM]
MTIEKKTAFVWTWVLLAIMAVAVLGYSILGNDTLVARKTDEVTVAYFLEWPTPSQFAQARKIYEKELGVAINWRAFETGTAMSAAMASGDVQISFSQGIAPFVIAVSAGQDLQVVDVSESYSDSDNCVVRAGLEIDKTNVRDLEGKQVAVPLGTVAHYGFLKQMAHFGVDISTMTIVDMAPSDSAAAFASGNLDMVCGWGGPLRRMKKHGNVLLTGAEKEALGIRVFDVTTVPAAWARENARLLTKFLRVTADVNARFMAGERETMLPVIAKAAGMDEGAAGATLDGFYFPTVEAQLSAKWLGGGVQTFLKEIADFFVEQGVIDSARASYESAVDASYLVVASKM